MLSTALCLIRRRDRRARVQTVRVDRATDNERPGVTVHVGVNERPNVTVHVASM